MAFTSVEELVYEPQNVALDTLKGKWLIFEFSWDGTSVTTGAITVPTGTIKSNSISGDKTGDYFVTLSGNVATLNFPSGATGSFKAIVLRK